MKTVKIAPIHLSSLDIPKFRFYHSMKNFCTACVVYPHNFHLMNAMGMLHFLLHCVGPMSGERVRWRWDTETSPLRPLVGLSFDDLADKLQGFGLTFGERGWCKSRNLIHTNIQTKHPSPNQTPRPHFEVSSWIIGKFLCSGASDTFSAPGLGCGRKPCQIYVSQKISLLSFSLVQKKYRERLSRLSRSQMSNCKNKQCICDAANTNHSAMQWRRY